MAQVKVLILGAGGAASNGFARALRLAGGYQLVGTNSNPDDLLLSECEENHVLPHVRDYDEWRIQLALLIGKTKPDFVHAQADVEVEALGRFRTVCHMYGAKTYLPSQQTINVCQDKWASYRHWREAGVPVPETVLCAKDMPTDFFWRQKVWLRPRIGAGGQKSFVANDPGEARWWLDRNDGWDAFTAAEVLTPETVTVQLLYWQGELVCSQQRSRETWANAGSTTTGVSGSTGIGVTTSDPLADETALHAVDAVDAKPHGLFGVDMCRDQKGVPRVTEINIGRFFTTMSELCAMAGFNMADIYAGLCDTPTHSNIMNARNPIPDGYRFVRSMDHLPVLVPPGIDFAAELRAAA